MDSFKIGKLTGTGIALIIGVIGLLATILIYVTGSGVTDVKKLNDNTWIDLGLNISYFGLILGTILAAGVFVIKSYIQNPKSLIKAGIWVAVLGIMLAIGYFMANDFIDLNGKSVEQVDFFTKVDKGAIKWSDAGLHMLYIMSVVSILVVIVTEVLRRFR